MADKTVVHIGENSPEEIAFKLLQIIAEAEDRPLNWSEKRKPADREYVLSTYAQCVKVVRNGYHEEK
jgi:hypothetical protein